MKCIICGNNIKEGLRECPVCGSQQLSNPIYNTQQYDELQTQIQHTQAIDVEQINRRLQEQQMQQAVPQQYQTYQQPINQYQTYQSSYQQPINQYQTYQNYQQPINQYPPVVKKNKSAADIISVIAGGIGIYYTFSLLTVINSGIDTFILENFNSPEYADIVREPLTMTLCMTWPLFLAPIVGLILAFTGRKKVKNGLNTFGIVCNAIILAAGVVTTFYIYNYLS